MGLDGESIEQPPPLEERGGRADERERIADERERIAEQRERRADERERQADERERQANERERLNDQRERALNQREEEFYELRAPGLGAKLRQSDEALIRARIGLERARAGIDRQSDELDRRSAEFDRESARSERDEAEVKRAIAQSERTSTRSERAASEAAPRSGPQRRAPDPTWWRVQCRPRGIVPPGGIGAVGGLLFAIAIVLGAVTPAGLARGSSGIGGAPRLRQDAAAWTDEPIVPPGG